MRHRRLSTIAILALCAACGTSDPAPSRSAVGMSRGADLLLHCEHDVMRFSENNRQLILRLPAGTPYRVMWVSNSDEFLHTHDATGTTRSAVTTVPVPRNLSITMARIEQNGDLEQTCILSMPVSHRSSAVRPTVAP